MFTFVLFVILFSFFAVLWCYFKWTNRQFNRLAAKLNGPTAYPLIGSMLEFVGTPTQIMDKFTKLSNDYGTEPFKLWFGPYFTVFISKPEDVQVILNSSKALKKAWFYKYFKLVGEGLVTAPVDKWKKHRRIINPAFNTKQLKHFFPIFNKKSEILIENLKKELNNTVPFNLLDHLLPTTLETICQTALGYNLDTRSKAESEFGNALIRLQQIYVQRNYKPWLYPNIVNSIYERLTGIYKLNELVFKLPLQIINEKKQETALRKSTNKVINVDKLQDKKHVKAFLDILLELDDAGANFSVDDLRDEVVTMMVTGSETTGLSTCFCLLMLAIHQDIQDKVCDEIYNVFGEKDDPISIEDVNKLPFLEQVLMETLRLYPTLPVIFRELEKDINIWNYLLPKGTSVAIFLYSTHQSSELFPNPSAFNPENFSQENIAKRHKYSYIPFSGGARGCIGSKYAMLSMKVLLCKFLQNFSVHTVIGMSDIQLSFDLSMRTANGYPVTIRARERTHTTLREKEYAQ